VKRWPLVIAGLLALLVAAGCSSSSSPASPHQGTLRIVVPPLRPHGGAQADWPTYDRTAGRSGVSVSSPVPGKVRRSWTASVDGPVYAQPLVVGSEVIIATENDSVYALNFSTGAVLWRRHLATPVPNGLPCGNVNPSGITGTPVADVAAGTLWVVTFTARPSFRHVLWELDTASGKVVGERPVDARGSDPKSQQERGALTLLGSRVYVPFGGLYGDCSDYKGRVVGAPLSGIGKLVSFATDNQRQAGIWAPAGESVRGTSLYVTTGNGMPVNRVDDSDSVLRLNENLAVLGRFTPSNFESLSSGDQDLGSTAPALLPGGLVFQVGKQGIGYVMHDTRLGGTGGQLTSAQVCEGGFGGDIVDGSAVVFSCYSSLRAVRVSAHRLQPAWSVSGIQPGPPIIAGGVVWDVARNGTLNGYSLSGGTPVFSAKLGKPVTDFPSLAASGSRLIVPEGSKVVSFTGI
jgi:hypothetical protein